MSLHYILYTWCSITQSVPHNEPALVTPNFDKLDLPTLEKAIPKYARSGLTSNEILWWNAFIEMLQEQQHQDAGAWLLNDVISLQRSLAVTSPQPAISFPTPLIEMVTTSTQAIPEVHFYYYNDCTSCIHEHY